MKGLNGRQRRFGQTAAVLAALSALVSGTANAGLYNDGKVLLTEGVSIIDGSAGGGITPWAVISGYETRDGVNGTLHYTYAYLPDYSLNSVGGAIGLFDRIELSFTDDTLPTGSTYDTVGLLTSGTTVTAGTLGGTGIEPFNTTVHLDIFGAKVRLFGEAIYDSDNLIPQVAIGGFYKMNRNKELLKTLGADKSKDFEVYGSITKIFFPVSTLINITGRYSSANQTGLVGFGGNGKNDRTFRVEGSLAYLLNKGTAIGGEYAVHSNNLNQINLQVAGIPVTTTGGTLVGNITSGLLPNTLVQKESDWKDVFVAFAPSKNVNIVMAYAMLGNIVLTPHQNGFYFSVQAAF